MEIKRIEPPREFGVGKRGGTLRHCADVQLDADEQVTFVAAGGSEHDLVRKSWGYYATGSLNGRLPEHGLRPVLCIGVPREGESARRAYLMLVEPEGEPQFRDYLRGEGMEVVCWLDSDAALTEVAERLAGLQGSARDPGS